jgi:hypothetical protein
MAAAPPQHFQAPRGCPRELQELLAKAAAKRPLQEAAAAPGSEAVRSLFDGAKPKLPERLAHSVQAWCLCRGGAVAAAARGSDPQALARALLSPKVAAATGRVVEAMNVELGLRLVAATRLEQALLAAARGAPRSEEERAATSTTTATTPKVTALSVEVDIQAQRKEEEEESSQLTPRPGDAVERLFDAAKLPRRLTYAARAWCLCRGGSLAALARGSDPQALARALVAPGHLVEEMIGELGCKIVEGLHLRKALSAALRAPAVTTPAEPEAPPAPTVTTAPATQVYTTPKGFTPIFVVPATKAVLAAAAVEAVLPKKRMAFELEGLEEEIMRACKALKRSRLSSPGKVSCPATPLMAAMAA